MLLKKTLFLCLLFVPIHIPSTFASFHPSLCAVILSGNRKSNTADTLTTDKNPVQTPALTGR